MITHRLGEEPGTTQDTILFLLKKEGELSVSDLCDHLKITAMAVRRHLATLQKDGLVDSQIVRQSRGRPSYRYSLSQKGESLFPAGYQTLALDLLEAVQEHSGAAGVLELLKVRNKKRLERLGPRVEGLSLPERVKEVSKIFSEDGYMTEWKELEDGNYFIFQRHCALHDVASKFRQVCALEPFMMENLLGTKVTREKYMLNNDSVCGYVVHAGSCEAADSFQESGD